MNQAVSTILIPLLLVSQSLCSVPHSHVGTSVCEPDGHSARPHVHLHHADHHDDHDDGNESQSSPDEQFPEHDSDALYASDIQLLNDSKVVEVADAEMSLACVICNELAIGTLYRLCNEYQLPPILHLKCAIYLQLLSIRC
jgi:hypothetical protein